MIPGERRAYMLSGLNKVLNFIIYKVLLFL